MDFVHPVRAVIPGAQGRVLSVLAETTAELSLTTLARLADVSVAQTSRVMPQLVSLGLVSRREVGPSSLVQLVRDHVAVQPIIDLTRSRERALQRIGAVADSLPVPPVSVIVFGSFARGEADELSDIDAVVVRPADVDPDADDWAGSVQQWQDDVRTITGNRVEVVEVGHAEVGARLASSSSLWRDVVRDGISVHGPSIDHLRAGTHA